MPPGTRRALAVLALAAPLALVSASGLAVDVAGVRFADTVPLGAGA